MDSKQFVKNVDLVANFLKNYHNYYYQLDVSSSIQPEAKPGFVINEKKFRQAIKKEPTSLDECLNDFKSKLVPYLTQNYHPSYYNALPCSYEYENVLADMLSLGLGGDCSSWDMNPSMVELEQVTLGWYRDLLNLPDEFSREESKGNGRALITSTPEDDFYCVFLAAREKFFQKNSTLNNNLHQYLNKLTVYASPNANVAVFKVCKMENARLHLITNPNFAYMDIELLRLKIEEDLVKGYYPLMIVCTLGYFTTFEFDDVFAIFNKCKCTDYTWIHVDGGYGGNALALSDFQYMSSGMELANSVSIGAHYFTALAYDFNILYIRDINEYAKIFQLDNKYDVAKLEKDYYSNYGITSERRYRALKMWLLYGVRGSDTIISDFSVASALRETFSLLLQENAVLEVVFENFLFVYFKLKNSTDDLNKTFYNFFKMNANKFSVMPINLNGEYCIRAAIQNPTATSHSVYTIAEKIKDLANEFILSYLARSRRANIEGIRKTTDFD